ncbi:MAG: peptidoglycan-binding domain-containing protein [Clostridia bacterium]|nr:peptidoglycan-binding domain-containing protein [Clostridia bacterium]
MKRLLSILAIAAMLLALGAAAPYAGADPTDTPPAATETPASSATPSTTVYQYNSTGVDVYRIQLRLRELGFFMYKPTGSFQSMTVDAAIEFQKKQVDSDGNPIFTDGAIGPQSLGILFSTAAARADILVDIPFGGTSAQLSATGDLVLWSDVRELLSEGTAYTVIDCYTGTEFNMVFTGGENHAEMECATADDTAIYESLFGGEFNYSKRPVCLRVGARIIAASLQGEPHGAETLANNGHAGHACLYFEGSSSHVGSLPDIEHAAQVYRAAGR